MCMKNGHYTFLQTAKWYKHFVLHLKSAYQNQCKESASFNAINMFTFTHVTETRSSRQTVHEYISHYNDPVQSSSHQFPKHASWHCPPTPLVYQQSHCCYCHFVFSYDLPVQPVKPLRLHFYKKK